MTTVRSPGAAAAAADYHYYNVSAFVTGLIGDTSREAALSYPELLRTEEQEQALSEILGILSANYLVKILPNIPNLERAGTRIDGLHPFRSFGFFLSNIERREKLKIVLNYHTPWPIAFVKDKFLEGFSTALEHRAKNILLSLLQKSEIS